MKFVAPVVTPSGVSMGMHEYLADPVYGVVHNINGEPRAYVPVEYLDAYLQDAVIKGELQKYQVKQVFESLRLDFPVIENDTEIDQQTTA